MEILQVWYQGVISLWDRLLLRTTPHLPNKLLNVTTVYSNQRPGTWWAAAIKMLSAISKTPFKSWTQTHDLFRQTVISDNLIIPDINNCCISFWSDSHQRYSYILKIKLKSTAFAAAVTLALYFNLIPSDKEKKRKENTVTLWYSPVPVAVKWLCWIGKFKKPLSFSLQQLLPDSFIMVYA